MSDRKLLWFCGILVAVVALCMFFSNPAPAADGGTTVVIDGQTYIIAPSYEWKVTDYGGAWLYMGEDRRITGWLDTHGRFWEWKADSSKYGQEGWVLSGLPLGVDPPTQTIQAGNLPKPATSKPGETKVAVSVVATAPAASACATGHRFLGGCAIGAIRNRVNVRVHVFMGRQLFHPFGGRFALRGSCR